MAFIVDAALDAALDHIRTNATVLHVCSSEPANFAGIAAVTLGNKASPTIGANGDATGGGRKATVAAINDGSVTGTGTGSHWAIASGSVLLASGSLSATQSLTSGNTLTLSAFDIRVADATSA